MKPDKEEREIENVRFRDAVYLGPFGSMAGNFKMGHHNGTVVWDKGGVLIDIPGADEKQRFVVMVPFSNIKQIEFAVK